MGFEDSGVMGLRLSGELRDGVSLKFDEVGKTIMIAPDGSRNGYALKQWVNCEIALTLESCYEAWDADNYRYYAVNGSGASLFAPCGWKRLDRLDGGDLPTITSLRSWTSFERL